MNWNCKIYSRVTIEKGSKIYSVSVALWNSNVKMVLLSCVLKQNLASLHQSSCVIACTAGARK